MDKRRDIGREKQKMSQNRERRSRYAIKKKNTKKKKKKKPEQMDGGCRAEADKENCLCFLN